MCFVISVNGSRTLESWRGGLQETTKGCFRGECVSCCCLNVTLMFPWLFLCSQQNETLCPSAAAWHWADYSHAPNTLLLVWTRYSLLKKTSASFQKKLIYAHFNVTQRFKKQFYPPSFFYFWFCHYRLCLCTCTFCLIISKLTFLQRLFLRYHCKALWFTQKCMVCRNEARNVNQIMPWK